MDLNKLNMSDESLIHLLNFILTMIKEDRHNALQHHDTLSTMLGGPAGGEGMTSLELQLLLNDVSVALTNFIKNAAQSTDQAIKVAKLLADHLIKVDKTEVLTADDRDSIEDAIKNFKMEKTELDNIVNFDFGKRDS